MKHAADPEKFVESELDLDDGIRKLHALATAPALYPELVYASPCYAPRALHCAFEVRPGELANRVCFSRDRGSMF